MTNVVIKKNGIFIIGGIMSLETVLMKIKEIGGDIKMAECIYTLAETTRASSKDAFGVEITAQPNDYV